MIDQSEEVATLRAEVERLRAQVETLRNALVHGIIYAASQPAALRPLSADERQGLHRMAQEAKGKFERELFGDAFPAEGSDPVDAR